MSDHNDLHTHTRETHVERHGSGGTGVLAFIVGGLVVAVGVLGFVFWSGGSPEGSGGNAAESAAESAASSAETAAESAGNAAESAGDAAESAAEGATGEE
ncbi:hypothetical protein OCH239_03330 [Roseivivax halodurans JCM 10272]|uniref:Uncharacterized protein n=1 Tax=Roseivivax halodurans JCM 10272 TaxID=1449350 RepID=X7EE27_9RHOB|nr:hypothetical protein [Roseivivax halodurans]ETX14339.1 hypothetical protein OCH239_03330 [Roseivivax halodurans JCM 10272]